MKTSVDIPDDVLDATVRFTKAKTKREAIVTAMEDYVRRQRMAELRKYRGTFDDFLTVEELQQLRRT